MYAFDPDNAHHCVPGGFFFLTACVPGLTYTVLYHFLQPQRSQRGGFTQFVARNFGNILSLLCVKIYWLTFPCTSFIVLCFAMILHSSLICSWDVLKFQPGTAGTYLMLLVIDLITFHYS